MNWLFDLLDRVRAAYRARRSAQALADLQRGADILAQAQREAQEMRAAQAALDASLSTPPTVPAAPAPGVPARAPAEIAPMPPPVPGGVASSPEDITARIRKP